MTNENESNVGQPENPAAQPGENPVARDNAGEVTDETLLSSLIGRLENIQAGASACAENQHALVLLRHAAGFLRLRTERRTQAGTEGTHASA